MTALPLQQPEGLHLLSVAEYAALPESTDGHFELQEGIVMMSPRPRLDHQAYLIELAAELRQQIPRHLQVIPEVDVDMELVPRGAPGFVRVPDLVVVPRTARKRVRAESGILRASEIVLAIEIISLSSRRMDTVIKHAEYADAGIPHYWIIDIEPPISLVSLPPGR